MKPLFTFCLLAGLAFGGGTALAQPGAGGPTPGVANATAIPLDGGLSLLLAAGGAYGLRRLRGRRSPAGRC